MSNAKTIIEQERLRPSYLNEKTRKGTISVNDLEDIDKLKEWVKDAIHPTKPKPGKKPKKFPSAAKVLGLEENEEIDPEDLLDSPYWVHRVLQELGQMLGESVTVDEERSPDYDPEYPEDDLDTFVAVTTDGSLWRVFKDEEDLRAKAIEIRVNELQTAPENFYSHIFHQYIDWDRIRDAINYDRMDGEEIDDPEDWLKEVYGDQWIKHAIDMGGQVPYEELASLQVRTDGLESIFGESPLRGDEFVAIPYYG